MNTLHPHVIRQEAELQTAVQWTAKSQLVSVQLLADIRGHGADAAMRLPGREFRDISARARVYKCVRACACVCVCVYVTVCVCVLGEGVHFFI